MNNPILIMDSKKEQFSQNDLLIYQQIKDNPEHIVRRPISQVAASFGVSQPALTRFIKVIGYERYADFRSDMTYWLAQYKLSESDNESTNFYSIMGKELKAVKDYLSPQYMKDLAHYINKFKKVYATGFGRSSLPAQLLDFLCTDRQMDIKSLSFDQFVDKAEYTKEDELVIVFSVSISQINYDWILRTNAKVLVITANQNTDCYENIDRSVNLPYVTIEPEASYISSVVFNVFVELLVQYLSLERKK